jgi:uncharacterized protein (TIGR02265 family)
MIQGNLEAVVARRPSLHPQLDEFREQIAHTPAASGTNGMYVVNLLDLLRKNGVFVPGVREPQRFRHYPLRECMELLLLAAVTLHPDKTVGEGLRRLGRLVIPTFAQSLAGSVMMSVAACSWEAALGGLTRGYSLSLRPGEAHVAEFRRGHARVELRGIWSFGDTYQVGVVEGLMKWCDIDGRTVAKKLSRANTDITLEWSVQ